MGGGGSLLGGGRRCEEDVEGVGGHGDARLGQVDRFQVGRRDVKVLQQRCQGDEADVLHEPVAHAGALALLNGMKYSGLTILPLRMKRAGSNLSGCSQ